MSPTEWWSAGMAMVMAGSITFGVFAVVGAIMMRRVALAHHLEPAPGTLERIRIRRDRFWRVFGSYTYAVDGRSYRGYRGSSSTATTPRSRSTRRRPVSRPDR